MAKKDLPPDVAADTVSVIYYCPVCEGKHTFGIDYFTEVGEPDACPNCGTKFEQADKILRKPEDTDDDLENKRTDLLQKRGQKVKVREKPTDSKEIKKQRVKELQDEIDRLEGRDPKEPNSIKLGP
jgi:DNA replicative helicase MCM subunit Mcm2 (Cdc46/Mcm family)